MTINSPGVITPSVSASRFSCAKVFVRLVVTASTVPATKASTTREIIIFFIIITLFGLNIHFLFEQVKHFVIHSRISNQYYVSLCIHGNRVQTTIVWEKWI